MNEKLEKLNQEIEKTEARLRRAQHKEKMLEQGGRGVLAIINSQFIGWCPPFGSFGLVAGAVDHDSPETLLTFMLAFPAEFIVASAPPVVQEESKLFLQLL